MNTIVKSGLILIVLVVVGYFTQDYWIPTMLAPSTEYITEEAQNNTLPQEVSYATNGCLTVTSPAVNAQVSFPLTMTVSIDYGCRNIFEAQAGIVTVSQDNQIVSSLSPLFVVGDYYDQSSYPVTAQATIYTTTAISGAVELIITPENLCGNAPECPPVPALIVVSVVIE